MATVAWAPTVQYEGRTFAPSGGHVKTVGGKSCMILQPAQRNFIAFVIGTGQIELKNLKNPRRGVSLTGTHAYAELVAARNAQQSDALLVAPGALNAFWGGDAEAPPPKRKRKGNDNIEHDELMTVTLANGDEFECARPHTSNSALHIVIDEKSMTTVLKHLSSNITVDTLMTKRGPSRRHATSLAVDGGEAEDGGVGGDEAAEDANGTAEDDATGDGQEIGQPTA